MASENENEENIDREIGETRDEGVGEMGDGYIDGEERVRRPPAWMDDYVSGEGLFEMKPTCL